MTSEELKDLKARFLLRLGQPANVARPKQKFVLVIGGAPGSGKTTTARAFSLLLGAFHVQANSARQLLREQGMSYGENVHEVVRAVAEELLSTGSSVIIDGMVSEEKERQLIKDVAAEHSAPVFFIALTTDPEIAKERAEKRYAAIKPSTFDDWRASPKKFEDYYASIGTGSDLLEKNLAGISDDIDGVLRINNNGDEIRLAEMVIAAWDMIKKRI